MQLEFKFGKIIIQVQTTFFVLMFCMIALQWVGHFFMLFMLVTLHEASHIIVAKRFGLRIERVVVTPMGQAAIIDGLHMISREKRVAVFIAGPFCNIILAICGLIATKNLNMFFIQANLFLAFWNLIPANPLDGGRILHLIISQFIGVVPASRVSRKISRIIAIIIFVCGLVYAVLYPYDISVALVAFYLFKISENETINTTFTFYKTFIAGKGRFKEQRLHALRVKYYAVPSFFPIKKAVEMLNYDCINIFIIMENGILTSISEQVLICHAESQGILGTINAIFGLAHNTSDIL